MNESTQSRDTLQTVAQVLIRSFIIGAVLLLFTVVFMAFVSDLAYDVHSRFYQMTRPQFDLIIYCGLGLMKIMLFIFFLIPYIAIRLVLAKSS